MYKYRKVIFWVIVMAVAFTLGTWIAERAKNNLKADIIAEIEANTDSMTSVTNQEHRSNLSGTTAMHFDDRVFCPVCQEKGMTSIVYVGWSYGTLLYSQPYYDEEGNYHHSDPNTYTTHYSCSIGHEWHESSCAGESWIRITKDTEGEEVGIIELEDPENDEYIKSELGKEELIIEEPEQILIEFTSTGEWKDTFKPSIFIKVTDTDLSKCFIDGRLRLELNGEIYWIRLEKDDEYIPYMPTILELNSYGRKVDLMWDFLLSSLQDWEDISGNKSSEGKGNQE